MPVDGAERAAVELAGRQHGVISLEQLKLAGLGRHPVAHRVKTGWLRPLHRGVYLVGPLESAHSRLMAAALAAGPGALISHYPAAVLWGLRAPREGPVDVTIPDRRARNRPGIRVHTARLHPHDATRRLGIPVTSAARTLLDLAASEPTALLERAVNEAEVQRRVSLHSLIEQFSRYPRHRGTAALKDAMRLEPKLTRSRAERLMLALIREAGLPIPDTNVIVAGHEIDMLWRDQRLMVEIDSWEFHSVRRSFEHDRERDQALVAAGWRVVRVTWRQITRERIRVAATLATALAA